MQYMMQVQKSRAVLFTYGYYELSLLLLTWNFMVVFIEVKVVLDLLRYMEGD
eukprot:CAMPEP_0116890068 /NCGR_PEP_ID=MMETSP0467-20121206/608_1 /TAXON_ID=283647 /ORGANISM="Mesodinium pulex, Strain SPMC105" /LENGTH=51 /DNA_ID=CAMNT_0004557461 /DNA_START=425 /DNA_END=580 /DNA_ORIENTATION=+